MNKRTWIAAFRKAFATSAAVAGIATLLVVTAGTANAQDAPPPPQGGGQGQGRGPGMGGPGMGGPGPQHSAQLVNRPDVGKDLAITEDQRSEIRDMMDKFREKMQARMQPPDDGEQPDFQAMRAQMDKMQGEMDKAIAKVLTASQNARLKEIKVQLAGPSAVLDKEIAAEIGITDDQKTKIDAIAKANRPQRGPGGPGGPGGPDGGPGGPGFGGGPGGPGGNPGMEKARKAMNDAIEAILTDSQKAALKKMAGTKKFVAQPRPQGGPGQGGPRGGFGGPGGGGPGGPGGPDGQGQGGPGFGF